MMPAGVLAVRAGLATEAGRDARVAQRQRAGVQDLVGVVGGERHLGGADEVEVVLLEVEDVLGCLSEEAGALHRGRLDEHRRDHRGESCRHCLLNGDVHQGQLEQCAGPVR